ncbi:DUF1127 domain-containing protein [Bradyrhizobium niftali]|uniref:DUF1127 domain-containing protein n=1 Tax=Bradyrhizobium niftali TaxID=2560055 RepID=A0A4Y9KXF1_9BRAD|nr:DUF1127 domain-containing protein [Bradyrhizobium niftali]TFV35835.1 DUF1127 domain-containing protein [Bradyrhizobium niftali]
MTTTELGQAIASAPQIFRLFKASWTRLQERRKQEKARAALYDLNDRELKDIGIARGEIEYVASNRSIDPRGACSSSPISI